MDNHSAALDLVAYHKGELEPEEHAKIKEALEGSESLREELKAIEATFKSLHRELVPIELSAHFRIAMAERLDEATQVAALAREDSLRVVRSSERYIRDMSKPTSVKLWEHARRSPYFAASMLLHAAAALIIVAIIFKYNQNQPTSAGVNTGEIRPLVAEIEKSPDDEQRMMRTAWSVRKSVASYRTKAMFSAGGFTIDLTETMESDGAVVLIPDRDLKCLVARFTDREGRPSSQSVFNEFAASGAVIGSIENSRLRVSGNVAGGFFAADDDLRVFQMENRLELWAEARWNQLSDEFGSFTAAPSGDRTSPAVASFCATPAALLRRDEIAS